MRALVDPIRRMIPLPILMLALLVLTTSTVARSEEIGGGGAAGDLFGIYLGLSADTAVVGATRKDFPDAQDQGAAYVFERSGNRWSSSAVLSAADGEAGDEFGVVGISADTIIVGAPFDDVGAGPEQGSVNVYVRSGNGWTLQTRLTASDGKAGDRFGVRTVVSGDTAVVSAIFAGAAGSGAVYIFERTDGQWAQTAKLGAQAPFPSLVFGRSLAISGNTVLVGASGQRTVYAFVRNNGSWVSEQIISYSLAGTTFRLGAAVALDGDLALLGAPSMSPGGVTSAGSVVVFTRTAGVWSAQAVLGADDPGVFGSFGTSVAVEGNTAVIGAPGDPANGAIGRRGALYVFESDNGVWRQDSKLVGADAAADDQLGFSAALSGETALAGVPFDDVEGEVDQGSVAVFVRDGSGWMQQSQLIVRTAVELVAMAVPALSPLALILLAIALMAIAISRRVPAH